MPVRLLFLTNDPEVGRVAEHPGRRFVAHSWGSRNRHKRSEGSVLTDRSVS